MRKEAVDACQQWAQVRCSVLLYAEHFSGTVNAELVEQFDEQMFRLGAVVFSAEGEVTNVERISGKE